MKTAAILIALASLLIISGCSSRIEVHPCRLGSNLAFSLDDEAGWFSTKKKPRPLAIGVSRLNPNADAVTMWDTEVPSSQLSHASYELAPAKSLIIYGGIFSGWALNTKSKTLDAKSTYDVDVMTYGGEGRTTFHIGQQLPPC